MVELILSDAGGVAKKIVSEERLGGTELLEEAITAEEERGDLGENLNNLKTENSIRIKNHLPLLHQSRRKKN